MATRLFKERVDAVLEHIIKGSAQHIGLINDHWFRVVFQNRGSPHVHAILWASLTHEDVVYSGNQLCDLMGSVCASSQPTESADAEQADLLDRNKLASMLDKYVSACIPLTSGSPNPERAEPVSRNKP